MAPSEMCGCGVRIRTVYSPERARRGATHPLHTVDLDGKPHEGCVPVLKPMRESDFLPDKKAAGR